MIRSVIALVLTASVATPAFAQSSDEKIWGTVTSLKEKIVQYDEGTGKALAYYGGKTVKYSLIAIGAAYATTKGAAETSKALFSRGFFSSYNTASHIGRITRTERLSKFILNGLGGPALAIGVGLLGTSAVVFMAEHLYYGTVGHPDQTASNSEFAQFLSLPTEQQVEIARANPAFAERLSEINDSITVIDAK